MGGIAGAVAAGAAAIGGVIAAGSALSSSGYGGYSPSVSSTDEHAKKIADELSTMKEEKKITSTKLEEKILNYINTTMNAFIKELNNINNNDYGGKKLNININDIKKKNEALEKNVIGHISRVMEERLVLTDAELSEILKEKDDKKRKKDFSDFCKKVEQSALTSLQSEVKSTIKQQNKLIRTEIETRLAEVNKTMQQAKSAYDEILRIKESGSASMDYTQIKYIYLHELCDIMLDQL